MKLFINNELTELYLDERREIQKYSVCDSHNTATQRNNRAITTINGFRCKHGQKAYFIVNFKCSLPQISKEQVVYL